MGNRSPGSVGGVVICTCRVLPVEDVGPYQSRLDTLRNLHPSGHTRLPGYARSRRGTIAIIQGGWVLPDTNAHGRGECPEHVYAVCFSGEELWGEAAEPGTSVHIDLFESYLENA